MRPIRGCGLYAGKYGRAQPFLFPSRRGIMILRMGARTLLVFVTKQHCIWILGDGAVLLLGLLVRTRRRTILQMKKRIPPNWVDRAQFPLKLLHENYGQRAICKWSQIHQSTQVFRVMVSFMRRYLWQQYNSAVPGDKFLYRKLIIANVLSDIAHAHAHCEDKIASVPHEKRFWLFYQILSPTYLVPSVIYALTNIHRRCPQ